MSLRQPVLSWLLAPRVWQASRSCLSPGLPLRHRCTLQLAPAAPSQLLPSAMTPQALLGPLGQSFHQDGSRLHSEAAPRLTGNTFLPQHTFQVRATLLLTSPCHQGLPQAASNQKRGSFHLGPQTPHVRQNMVLGWVWKDQFIYISASPRGMAWQLTNGPLTSYWP